MRIKAGTLAVDITADGKSFEATLKRDDSLSEAFADNVDKRMKRVGGSLQSVGKAAGMTEGEMAALEKRMRDGLAADTASRALQNLKRYAGLTASEYASLAAKLGVASKESNKAGLSLSALTKRATAAAAAFFSVRAGLHAAGEAFNQFMGYESSLVDMGKVTHQSLAEIDAAIKGMPRILGDPTALMQGYYQTISAGVTDTAAAMDMLTAAAKAAKAAHVAQADTIKGLTKTMAGFDGEIRNATEASDLLFTIEKLGQTSFAELVPVVGDVAESTHLVGVSSKEMAAGLSLITQTSGSTAEAATKWKAIMVGLYKPTEDLTKVLDALGYKSGVDMVKQQGFVGALQTLQGVADRSGFSLGRLFESAEALTGIAGLSAQNWGRFADMLHQVEASTGGTDAAFQRWRQTSQAVKDTYDATMRQMAIEFGHELAPMMTDGMEKFSAMILKNKEPIVTALGGIATATGWITSGVMAATKEYERFANVIAAAVAVAKGQMDFSDWALSGPEELAGKLREAGERARAEAERQVKEAKTQKILEGDNSGTIPELAGMFPDLAPEAQTAKKAVDGVTVALGKAGDAAERFAAESTAALEQAQNQYIQLEEQYAGDTLGAKLAAIDKRYDASAAGIRKSMIGIKGSTQDAEAALAQLEGNRALEKLVAQADAWRKSMDAAAAMRGELGRLTDDPTALYGAAMTTAQTWAVEQQKRIAAIQDEAERTKQLGELQRAMDLKEVEARAQAYEGLQAVSAKYWEAERELLAEHLAVARRNATDETAYRIYAAEKWDDYNKRLLERQVAYSGSFAGVFTAKWSLAFGAYKSDLTQARDDYAAFADSCITLTNGIADALSGGLGDALRNLPDAFDPDALWKNIRSRTLDAVAGFVEKSAADTLKQGLGELGTWLFGSSGTGQAAKQVATPQAAIEAAQATITIASGTVSGLTLPGQTTGVSAVDPVQSGTIIGQTAGQVLAPVLIQAQAAQGQNITQSITTAVAEVGQRTAQTIPDALRKSIWYTHNNPGNLRIPGQTAFQQFDSMVEGLQGLYRQLALDYSRGYDTPYKLMSKYAPASDGNNTEQYAAIIAKAIGLASSRDKMDLTDGDQMQVAMEAITKVETGVEAEAVATRQTYANIAHQMAAQAAPVGLAAGQAAAPIIAAAVRLAAANGLAVGPTATVGFSQFKQMGGAIGSSIVDAFTADSGESYQFLKQLSSASTSGIKSLFTGTTSDLAEGYSLSDWQFAELKMQSGVDLGASSLNWQHLFGNVASMASGIMGLTSSLGSGNIGGMIGSGLTTVGGVASLMSSLGLGGPLLGPIGAGLGLIGGLVGGIFGGGQKSKRPTPDYAIGYDGNGSFNVLGFSGNANVSGTSKELYQMLKKATQSLKNYAKALDLSTDGILNFNIVSTMVYAQYLSGFEDYIRNTQVKTLLSRNGVRGAFDYLSEGGESYEEEAERLSTSYSTAGQYAEAFGYNLRTLSGVTQNEIDAMRRQSIERAGTIDSYDMFMGVMARDLGYIKSLFDAVPGNVAAAQNVSDERLAELYVANYTSKLIDAAGGEDNFKTVMQNLEKNQNNPLGMLQNQEAYYTAKSSGSIGLIGDAQVTIDNFWSLFNAAMQQTMSPENFEKWSYASTWVANLQTVQDAIESWKSAVTKEMQGLDVRQLTAAGLDKTASVTKQLTDQEWELYDARKANDDAATIAAIEETQRAEKAKALSDVLDEAQKALDQALGNDSVSELRDLPAQFADWIASARALGASEQQLAAIRDQEARTIATKLADVIASVTDKGLTDTESWLKDLHKDVGQAIVNARALGASEADLSRIRQASTALIAAKLGDTMDDVREALASYDGTDLAHSVRSLQKELSDQLYAAALLGATDADLTDIGTLYAYKVKAAYQDSIDDVVNQLQDAADALDDFSGNLKDLIDELWRGDDSPLPLGERYAEAKRQWLAAVADLGSSDDATRKAAQDKITDLTTDYLDLSKEYHADFASYYADFMGVQGTLGDQYTRAKSQYDRIQAQLDAATATEEHTKTTAELMEQLKSLQQEQGDTWTKMLTDLPQAIAEAVAAAASYRQSLGYATGGLVSDLTRSGGYLPGYSAGDVQPAVLRLGEFVMTPEAVQHYGVGLMDALNARVLPREPLRSYAAGGVVLDDGFVVRQNRALDTAMGGGSSGDEVAALRREVAGLREIVARMAVSTDKKLGKLVVNSDSVMIRGVKLQEAQ